jgi:hypothetical protein
VMVAIGGLVLLFGWKQWNDNLRPNIENRVTDVRGFIS